MAVGRTLAYSHTGSGRRRVHIAAWHAIMCSISASDVRSHADGGDCVDRHCCPGDTKATDTAASLPPLVLQALAHALDYLKAFSLERVLQVGAAFQPLHSVHEMALSPNTLRCSLCLQQSAAQYCSCGVRKVVCPALGRL